VGEPAAAPRVALIAGSEAALRAEARAALRARALGPGPADFDEDRFDFAESAVEPRRVIAALRTLPVQGPRRWVELRGLGERRAQSFLEGPLLEYLAAPLETSCLVLHAERIDRRQRWVKRVLEIGELLEYNAPSRPADLRRWIAARFAQRGVRAAPGAAELLAESIGSDLDALASEIDKLCLYAAERAEVTAGDVEQMGGPQRARAIYELTDLVGRRQGAAALSMLGRLLEQGEAPLAVLGALAQHFRRLLRARECQPQSAAELQKQLGIHPYAAERLLEQARRWSEARLRGCLELAQRTDESLKGALPIEPGHALEQLVLSAAL
jgi:DNA polymerase-3 subunit delta